MLSQKDFEELINNPKKYINNDIIWEKSAIRSFSLVFETKVTSDVSYPLVIKGKFVPLTEKLSYTILYNSVGRIYALDIGQDHKNPDGLKVGDKHKHRWVADVNIKDKKAYSPSDITALASEPKNVWEQFCLEAKIIHNGVMHEPPLFDLIEL